MLNIVCRLKKYWLSCFIGNIKLSPPRRRPPPAVSAADDDNDVYIYT